MILRIFTAVFVLSSASVATAEPPDIGTRQHGSDWPYFLGPTGNGKSSETGLKTPWPAGGPPIVWTDTLGGGYCMPAVSRGRLFAFSSYGKQMRLQCMNAETGEHLWKYEYANDYQDMYGYDNGPRAQPLVDDDRVYILGPEGMLHCLRVVDGQVQWMFDTSKKFGVIQNFFGVGCTPVIEGDLLIANIGGSPPEDQNVPPGQLDRVEGNDSGVVAFNKRTGEVVYQFSNELASYASPTLATIGDRRWCFIFARGGLLGFEPTKGKLDFHFPWRATILESVNASTPVVAGDEVFISETYSLGSALLKVRPGGYDVVWKDEPRSRDKRMLLHWNTPIVHDGYLYGSSGRHPETAELRCVELATGKVMWAQPGLLRSSLLYVDGHFICLGEQGDLTLLRANPEKYDEVSRVPFGTGEAGGAPAASRLLKAPCWAAPILARGLLYVRGRDRLVCLDLIP